MSTWKLSKGETILRKHLHDVYGGGRQGGISPSRVTPNIFIFSEPSEGEKHSYFDRWLGDVFLYVGEGQLGNQAISRGNRALLNHVADGRSIRLFHGCKGEVAYAGEFVLDGPSSYFTEFALDRNGHQREVIVFRLGELL